MFVWARNALDFRKRVSYYRSRDPPKTRHHPDHENKVREIKSEVTCGLCHSPSALHKIVADCAIRCSQEAPYPLCASSLEQSQLPWRSVGPDDWRRFNCGNTAPPTSPRPRENDRTNNHGWHRSSMLLLRNRKNIMTPHTQANNLWYALNGTFA